MSIHLSVTLSVCAVRLTVNVNTASYAIDMTLQCLTSWDRWSTSLFADLESPQDQPRCSVDSLPSQSRQRGNLFFWPVWSTWNTRNCRPAASYTISCWRDKAVTTAFKHSTEKPDKTPFQQLTVLNWWVWVNNHFVPGKFGNNVRRILQPAVSVRPEFKNPIIIACFITGPNTPIKRKQYLQKNVLLVGFFFSFILVGAFQPQPLTVCVCTSSMQLSRSLLLFTHIVCACKKYACLPCVLYTCIGFKNNVRIGLRMWR